MTAPTLTPADARLSLLVGTAIEWANAITAMEDAAERTIADEESIRIKAEFWAARSRHLEAVMRYAKAEETPMR